MKAYFDAKGLNVKVGSVDHGKNRLECIVKSIRSPKLIVNIVDSVYSRFYNEEKNFHMYYTGNSGDIRKAGKIHVFLTPDIWLKILSDPSGGLNNGYFVSQSRDDIFKMCYDNIDTELNYKKDTKLKIIAYTTSLNLLAK